MPITIRCPKCSTKLKIDDAFSAGVCRCGKCGQVMKVPKRKPADEAPQEPRAARPDAPGGSGGAPEVEDDPLAALAQQSEEPASPPPPPPDVTSSKTADDEPPARPEETSAASEAAPPPTPPKRKGNRMLMLVVIFGSCIIVGGLVALAIFALGGEKSDVPDEVRQELGFDPTVNPFTMEAGNVLGVPLASNAVIAIDASGTSRQWFGLVSDAIVTGAKKLPADAKLQVIAWVEGSPEVFPESGPGAMNEGTVNNLQSFLEGLSPSGQADAAPSLKKAIEQSPQQVVLITSQELFPDAMAELRSTIIGVGGKVKVDAIVIDESLPDLKEVIEGRGGRFVPMPQSRIEDWYREAGM